MGFKLDKTKNQQPAHSVSEKSKLSALLEKEVTLFGSSFSNKKKEDFYTELSVLLKAGINLKEALTLIEESQKKEKQQLFYHALVDGLVSGKNLSEVIQDQEEFTEYEYHSLKIGEETGTITEIITELGGFFAGKNEQRRNLVNALTYPIIILVTAVLVVTFMLRMVVPMFQDIFKQNKVELPTITKIIISASDFIGSYGWWIACALISLIIFRKSFTTKKWFKRRKDYLILKIPYIGKFMKVVYLAQFTQAVKLLTASKLPILNSIQLVGRMIDFYPLQEALLKVEERIVQGKGLSESLKDNTMFDHRMVSLVKVAEETNQTEFIFDRLNQQYAIEVQQKSKLLTTLMEPLIILIVGILVGVILVAMYLPMFKLGSVLG